MTKQINRVCQITKDKNKIKLAVVTTKQKHKKYRKKTGKYGKHKILFSLTYNQQTHCLRLYFFQSHQYVWYIVFFTLGSLFLFMIFFTFCSVWECYSFFPLFTYPQETINYSWTGQTRSSSTSIDNFPTDTNQI